MRTIIILLAGLLALTSCGSGDGGDDVGTTPKDTVTGDSRRGQDTGPAQDTTPRFIPECETDDDCPTGKACDCQQKCAVEGSKPCEEDKNCGGQGYCDPCIKWCFPKVDLCEPCNSENLCDPMTGQCRPVGNQCQYEGSHCLDFVSGGSFCGQVCLSDAGCPTGYTCQDLTAAGIQDKQCVPNSLACGTPGECEEDSDCEYGLVCNPNLMCVPGCQKDTECPFGKICSGFRCVDACHPVNNPCPDEEQVCEDSGHCMLPGGCIDQYDCPDPETFCDPADHMCKPGCMTDFDCKKASKECEDGECVDKPCPGNYWCNFGEVCDLDEGICEVPPEPFCEPGCQDDSECGPEGSKCIELQNEDGENMGPFCFPVCYDDPDNPCPQGYQCVELQDQNGAPAGEVCARACYEQPVGL